MNDYTEIEELDGNVYAAWEINEKLKAGFRLIAVRVERPTPDSKGDFEEKFHYLIGKPGAPTPSAE
jgi:long-subunit fatty acid transport protein